MRLIELMPETAEGKGGGPEIAGLTADSRAVRPGFLFAAIPGTKTDGRRFIADAVAHGAVAILTDEPGDAAHRFPAVTVIRDPDPRRRLALMAARFHAPQPRVIAAVTGTSGKTSVADFTRQIWTLLGEKAASIGTLGVIAPDFSRYGSHTTPDPVSLHRDLAKLARLGVEHVALEASSHGLDQHRLDGLELSAAAFTNLSHDHLDYHPDKDGYLEAKLRLFRELLPETGVAVLNADSEVFERVAASCRQRVVTYGMAADSRIRLLSRRPLPDGQELDLDLAGCRGQVKLPLIGGFQAENAMAAAGLAIACGAAPERVLAVLPRLRGVPGRLELAATHPNGAPIYVDYAHKPDALEQVLRALRPHTEGRLVVVFGCGGDRDPGKRPVMGEIAARLADQAIVTDDNPRGEEPGAIRAAILAACPGAREIGDREGAIETAISGLAPCDLLVIAGKGHETGQIVGDRVHPFDDAEVARECARRVVAGRAGGREVPGE